MLAKNTQTSYGLVTKLLHWLIGLMIIFMLLVGYIMQDIQNTADKMQVYSLHKATGILILLLVSVRLVWRLINITVMLPEDLPRWQKNLAAINIGLLYIAMFIMPISGFLMTIFFGRNINIYGLFNINSFAQNILFAKIFKQVHEISATILCILLIFHVLAAIYHHIIRKDNVLKRMWFCSKY